MLDLAYSGTIACIVLLVGYVSGYTTGSCNFSSSHDTCGYTLPVRWTIYKGQYRFHNKVTLINDGKGDAFYAFFDSSSPFEQLNRTGALQGEEPRNTSYDMTSPVIPPGTYNLSYWYILPATQSDLHVLLKPVNGTVQTELLSKHGKEDYWDKASVEINSTEAFQINFRGYRWAYGQFIGIDNIHVHVEPLYDHFMSKNFFCKRCSNLEYCVSLQKYQSISKIECYKVGMTLAQKDKADGTKLLTILTSCQLPLPVVDGEGEYLILGTGDGDASSSGCKRTYVRQEEHRSRKYYFTDEMACFGATTYPYVCERELPTTPTTPTTTTPSAMTAPSGLTLEDIIYLGCTSTRWNITVDMARLRQLYPNASRDNVFFGETSCKGRQVGYLLLFEQGLRECLTSERISDKKMIYGNDLFYAIFDLQIPIIRHHAWTFSMECDVSREEVTSKHVHHEVESHHASATSHYDVKLDFFKDPNYNEVVTGNPLHAKIGDDVYVKVFTTVQDWTIKMHVHSCYTKPGESSLEQTKYYLIKDGCEMDRNTHIISQSTHETRFVFRDFEYPANHEGLNIFCDATFCKSLDYSTRCLQVCNPGTRN